MPQTVVSLIWLSWNGRNVVNEFDNLLFKEQMSVRTLQDLSDSQKEVNRCGVDLSNPVFYPIKSRVPALYIFNLE